MRAGQLQETASTGPVRTLRITAEGAERGLQLAEVLHALALAHPVTRGAAWMEPFRRAAIRGEAGAWPALLRERLKEWASLDAVGVELAQRSVELPSGFLENDDAREAVIRAAAGKPLWPMLSMGKGLAKALVSSIKLDGASVRKDDVDGWRHVAAVVAHTTRRQEVTARWQSFTVEIGAPAAPNPKAAVDLARTVLRAADNAYAYRSQLSAVGSGSIGLDALSDDPGLCRSLADQIQAAAGAVRLMAVREHIRRNIGQFQQGSDRTSAVVWQFFEQAIGNAEVPDEKVESIWCSALQRIAAVKARAENFATIIGVTDLIAQAGAPGWAKRARTEPAPGDSIYNLMRAVFPNERLMLKEHFRCVEPIIRFSMQFYPEKMLPLRIPTAQERLDPPLVDIYLPHGRREKHRKVNRAEADVIVGEIKSLTAQSAMRNRSIGVISLIGPHQAEYIRAKLSETIGEELMQRHAILCGDSATFQGTERDIVFLSMVADPVHRTALTMLRYEQRFNVAVSRGRDRVVLVRSVRHEDLNPTDLKARLIEHFENPMPLETDSGDEGLAACDSGFERDLMQKLLDRGYRVQPQVGSLGFRIDMVVEGPDGRRLAVECDGDRFHGPEQWREDMRRQRVLERVGWRFWRCFASSFYRDSDRVIGDLFETLSRLGIEPMPKGESARPSGRFTEHRIIGAAEDGSPSHQAASRLPQKQPQLDDPDGHVGLQDGVVVGDKVVLLFGDDQRRISLRLTEGTHDLEKGLLSSTSAIGKAVNGAEEGDEIEFEQEDGRQRKALIENVDKGFVPAE